MRRCRLGADLDCTSRGLHPLGLRKKSTPIVGGGTVALFGGRRISQPQSPPEFDGRIGAQELTRLVDAFLGSLAHGDTGRAVDITQQVFTAMPSDPNARVSGSFFDDRWKWINAVAQRAEEDGRYDRTGKIGLFTQVWVRMLLKQDFRLQMGRLTSAPIEIELLIYTAALASLISLEGGDVLVTGPDGWTVQEAIGQIANCVRLLPQDGVSIPEDLHKLAVGDPATIDSLRGAPSPSSDREPHREAIDRVQRAIRDADGGDRASEAYLRGGAIQMNGGSARDALPHFEAAAQMGHVDPPAGGRHDRPTNVRKGPVAEINELGGEDVRRVARRPVDVRHLRQRDAAALPPRQTLRPRLTVRRSQRALGDCPRRQELVPRHRRKRHPA